MTWKGISLRARILLLVIALVLATLTGSLITMKYMSWLGSTLASMIDRDIVALKAAQELRTSLVMLKGFVAYYIQDGDPAWLEQLEQYQRAVEQWLKKARDSSSKEEATAILDQIESEYAVYSQRRKEVINLYRAGERKAGAELHREARKQFFIISDLCDKYTSIYERSMARAREEIEARSLFINDLSMAILPGVVLLSFLLAYILFKQILEPIRQMAGEPEAAPGAPPPGANEVKALSRRVQNLIEDVGQTKIRLERSQEHLAKSEKMALVGKLAAEVAHGIRNPLTSVKIRLFSMQRTLALSAAQKDDFEAISGEIHHLEAIVRNFLEFSRPPKLKVRKVSPSEVVEMVIELLRHRLDSYGVAVEVRCERRLPEIWADPEQLKEAMVNLVVNACEAMGAGGSIVIHESEETAASLGRAVVIRVKDSGPGIPESIQDRVFQPFFSTKEEGTGLGLSIAARIVEEHGGWLGLRSREGEGATFTITLPLMEDKAWAQS